MPLTSNLHARDNAPAAAGATAAARRRRRGLALATPDTSAACAAALQRSLDRRDNGGSTGH
ncbi:MULTISPECIES: hypothetical protein [Kitasatospora]|uniref:hypothetical protein n=1 Tax=Kitasatospora TaxID=2063 RepID=UPI000C702A7D|nr:hypothetical protein [Kitasatospora sp. GP30]MDH6145371.1 hypothetical protein [Kitasatospora sp. GP30]